MLDQETKRKIDSARNVLVGRISDPVSQVDHITTALIYKFMDDMDQEARAAGGAHLFFKGDLKKFSWPKLIDRKLSGQERLNLYIQALDRLPQSGNLPPLFREIFKNAFLPYRDAEALSLFLKEINGFTYENSENLGSAFEHLLSVLGSQKDAGQFRTPRHIIDFIVEAVMPSKEESVLDPACGTAGFLISAYKHIIKTNSKNFHLEKSAGLSSEERKPSAASIQNEGRVYKGEKLKPFEKRRLQKNITGYDISPKMVKLSLVNMFLHQFKKPQIYEYDTLTSLDRWEDEFDVILANPPFMSPKGGIRPHNKFSVKSSRSEVLFVDYIAGRLALNGRAGIIVPEGIVFKGDKAYKALRKTLVEDQFLWAVVSLPAHVFGKSGVKTDILFLDRKRAKIAEEILFIDVQNDGFELGATRRKIDKNDLPEALRVLRAWRSGERARSLLAHWVSRKKISESGDWNLTGNRYKTNIYKGALRTRQKQPVAELGEICEIFSGSRPKGGAVSSGVLSVGGEHINSDGSFNLSKPRYIPENFFNKLKRGKLKTGDVLIVKDGATTGKTGYFNKNAPFQKGAVNEHVFILRSDIKKIEPVYLYRIMQSVKGNAEILKLKTGAAQGGVNLSIKTIQIPVPPLEIQKEIVSGMALKYGQVVLHKAPRHNPVMPGGEKGHEKSQNQALFRGV